MHYRFDTLAITLLTISIFLISPTLSAQSNQEKINADQQDEGWIINLKGADVRDFIEQVSSITGQTFVIDPRVTGQVSVTSRTPLKTAQVYELFLSVMATHDISVLTQGDQAKIVPNTEAKTGASSDRPAPDSLETRIIQVQYAPVAELAPLIQPLIPQYGHLAAVTTTNALIISDRKANIDRIELLLNQLDQSGSDDYSVVVLKNAWVMDAAETLNSTAARGPSKGNSSTQVIADTRTNRLIIMGPPDARAKLSDLARELDTPTNRSASTRVIRLRHNDAKSLAVILGELSSELKNQQQGKSSGKATEVVVRADESLNALILLAEPDVVATLEDIVRQLDVPRAQVMVEAAIVEISGDISEALGVQWGVDGRGKSNDIGSIGGVSFANTGLSIGTIIQAIQNNSMPTSLPDGAIIGLGSNNFGALITALSANSNSNLLSTPSLLTLDNQRAEILVGQNVPFQTGSYTTDASGSSNPFTTIERKDIGVTLKVTPSINEGATLRLEIEQEISSIAPSTGLNAQAVDLITNKRMINSTILADDGQIIVLGGLIQDDVSETVSQVPLLSQIPLFGRLFRSSRESHIKRNLMIFLRPTIVRDTAGLAALSGKKYSDIHIFDENKTVPGRPLILPSQSNQLFNK